ncbi:type II toxin-antitoxin system RelE/ParE family toxin [[Limnothrix rosea] IAM M-220]|uniref:type II toxin-antitoxin system RelE/ParE family toxin n=1 Tax=[Limnothrix rosea] IAM M-220 TaxID=454133 RepID=UPI00095F08AE|nr:type II toxin-antitoxin system RelE/ParE family toxin [[Limnothrix rosea] IAM M-220]OKH17495.1 addiction module toxin RelE [[Limnothrix rosea] IAM M-220]
MKLPIFITSQTEQDLENIYDWYEKRSKGLGSEFIRIIDSNLAQIQRYPEAYLVVLKNLRRKIIRRFPYALFYLITEKQVTVLACLHLKQAPQQQSRFQ